MSFVNFVHLRSFPQFYPHRWISRHIGLSLICMSLIFLRFSFPLPLPQLYNTAFYCVSKILTANCEPTFITARLPVCLPACLEQDITIYRILCNRDITYYVCTLTRTTDAQWSLFSLRSQTFGLGQTNWVDKFWGIWGISGQSISTHFCAVSPLSIFFHFSTIISTKN